MVKRVSQTLLFFLFLLLVGISPAWNQTKWFQIESNVLKETDHSSIPSCSIIEQTDSVLRLEYSINSFSVSDLNGQDNRLYKLIRVDGLGLSTDVGSPMLPLRIEKIVIPDGKLAQVKVTSAGFTDYKDIDIYPAQELGTDAQQSAVEFQKNDSSYRNNQYSPHDLCQFVDVQIYRGISLGYLKICPVQYNPVTRIARIHQKLNIVIKFYNAGKRVMDTRKTHEQPDFQVLRNVVLNKKSLPERSEADKSGIALQPKGYLIITIPEFEEAAELLAQWKRQLGYYVQIITQTSWTIAQVKSTVTNIYNNSDYDFEYLTILGDQDHVPDYYYEEYSGRIFLKVYSENYYVCMNGSSDYIPEMAHGRISVRDADEALLVVEKIINYEKNPPTNPEFYTKGLHAGYFQDSTHDGVSDYRYAKTTIEMYDYMTARGFQSDLVLYTEPSVNPISFNAYFTSQTTLPSKYRRSNGYAWDGDKYDIISALNDGRLYAFHRDHGHYNEWVQPNVTVGDLNMLNNGNELPIVFSVNCGTGLFAKPEPAVCFAEKLQRHPNGGAVGIVAATAETVSGYNDAFIIGMMDAIWSNPGIIPDMGMGTDTATVIPHQPIYAMGDVMIQGLIRMTDTWDPVGWADKNHFHLYHYFGDPAMQVWTSAPVQLTALYDDELFIGSTSLHISGANCSDAIATICSGDEIWTKIRLQNGSGTIHFPAIDASVSYITLTISKHNYIPLEIYIPVTGYPEVEFTADQTEICPSDVVKFTDLTTNNPTFWHWMITPDFYEFVNSTNAYSQNPYIKFNSSGNYSISLTAVNGSGSQSLTKNGFINVFPTPEPPITHDRDKCFSDEIPTLSAEGSNVRWYADEQLTILLHEGNDYTPSQVLIGDNIYYVNQSVNGCVSDLASVSLTEYPPTPAPQVNDYTACETDTIFLIATGTYIKWYNDPNGEELLAEKDTLVLVSLPEGNYTYYASNTENSCESVLESVSLTVLPAAPVPLTNNYTICEYDTAICIAEGNHITWYSDPAGSEILKLGDTLIVCNLTPGEHIYYVGNAVNECYSVLVSSKVTVHAQPNLPISENVQACWGETVVLAADGENILWYSGIDEKSPIYSGNNLDLGQPEIGYYEYYLTQTVLNCESERLLVQLEVNNLPFFSLGGDTTINLGDTLEIQAPLSGQYLWFDGTTDSNLMFLSAEYGLGSNSCWLQITSNLECSYTDSINILVLNRPNRLPILDDKFTYILFPNPAESSVIIKLLQPDTIPAKVIVRDLQGRIHLRGSLDNTSNEIDLSQIPRGIYFITVITDKFDRTLRLILE